MPPPDVSLWRQGKAETDLEMDGAIAGAVILPDNGAREKSDLPVGLSTLTRIRRGRQVGLYFSELFP